MILHPPIIALVFGSLMIGLMVLYASFFGVQILRKWDLRSGSELQLALERKTYLVSTILSYAFGFQLFSLFLFVYTADGISALFVGAMCAAGALFVNSYGYPALILKIVNFLFAGCWLIINHADNRASDYPLVKIKYVVLLILTPLIVLEAAVQATYFARLEPDVITSCCGALFSKDALALASGIGALPLQPMRIVLPLVLALTFGTGLRFFRTGRGPYLFSAASTVAFVTSVAALISVISPYFYELPTHHCPFCILQKEYGYVGYVLYVTLLGGAIAGMGVGILAPFRGIQSLAESLPALQRRLSILALALYGLFTVMVLYKIYSANLRL